MLDILSIIFPVFALAGVGYAAAYFRVLRPRDNAGIARFVFSLAVPALLFYTLAVAELPGEFNWSFMFIYYGVSYVVFGLGMWINRRWFAADRAESAIFGLGASYSNLVLVGLPILSAAFGDVVLFPLFALISVQSLLMFPLVAVFASPGAPENGMFRNLGLQAVAILKNPIIASLLLGLAFRASGWQLAGPLDRTLDILGQAALPSALIVLGASLREHRLAGKLRQAWILVSLKMLLQPALVALLAFGVFDIQPLWATVAVMAAAMPTGVNTYVLAEQYQSGRQIASAAILISTILAIGSQALLLAWLS
jgi:hypothetical protein